MKPFKKVKMNLGKAMKAALAKQRNDKYKNYVMQFSTFAAPYASSVERIVLSNSGEVSIYSYFMINKKYHKKRARQRTN